MIRDHSDRDASKEPLNPLVTDSWVPLMHHDPSDFGSLILSRSSQNERSESNLSCVKLIPVLKLLKTSIVNLFG